MTEIEERTLLSLWLKRSDHGGLSPAEEAKYQSLLSRKQRDAEYRTVQAKVKRRSPRKKGADRP